ncbi:MFS transporter [Eggerthella sinensis]|uniref:MFS transporter n=1 Tax=Eggerthella sinensis TaxID=242230 RepID=UPI00266D4A9E|nr:MFS transporter [Eggerthella sinensis]
MGVNPARSSRAVTALVAGAAFLVFGLNNTETAALPSYVVSLGAGPFIASLQNSLFVFIAILLRLPLEGLVARRGSRFAMMAGAAGYTVPCLLLVGCTELWQIVALRLAQALGLALFQPSVAQYLTATSPASSLGRRLGIVRFATTASLMVGPVTIFPLIGSHGYPLFFGALTLAGACGTIIAFALPRDLRPSVVPHRARIASNGGVRPPLRPAPRPPLQRSLPLLASPLLLACGYSVIMNFGQTLSEETLAGCGDGILFACLSIGGLAGSLVAGWATDRFGAKRSVACTIASTAAGLLLMGLAQQAEVVLAGAFLCGAGYFGATATLVAAAGLAAGDRADALLARQQSALDAGMISGGLLAGAMLQGGLPVSAAFLATACAAGAALFAWGMMYPHQKGNR